MEKYIDIALVGDYNFSLTAHIATNLAVKDAEKNVEDVDINSFWLPSKEIEENPTKQLSKYDGFIICPGPYKSPLAVSKVIKYARENNYPLLSTCSGFKLSVLEFVENAVELKSNFKDNNIVVDKEVFSKENEGYHPVEIFLNEGTASRKYYLKDNPVEQTKSNWAIDSSVVKVLQENGFEVAARNSDLDAEIIELKEHPFFIACKFSPQFTTSEFYPHPLFTHFIDACKSELIKREGALMSN